MVDINLFSLLNTYTNSKNIYIDEPMSDHTSFRTGGKADYFVLPQSETELVSIVKNLKYNGINYFVMGNGSNLLVSDDGFRGVVICIGKGFSNINVSGEVITAQAGALLSKIANVALGNSLSGFEFASGIPGSLGGAVVMNAGAYGGEIKDVVISTRYIDCVGNICEVCGDEHEFAYRKSRFLKGEIILESKIKLNIGEPQNIKALMDDFNSRRREKQPLEYPSAGSTFKRPEGYFAAKLIDDAGLRGFCIGGAMVSQKHCGFVINANGATSKDIFELMKHIQSVVYDKFNVKLENEVRLVGDF